jgi:curli biogenesis system outer membrane secretion channel CsgG
MTAVYSCSRRWLGSLFVLLLAHGVAGAATKKPTLAVANVRATPSLMTSLQAAKKLNSLNRVMDALNVQLLDRFNATRKFTVVARGDLPEVIREQEMAGSGNVNPNDPNAAQAGQLTAAKYLVVTTIDDFEDATETMNFSQLGRAGVARWLRLSATAKIYDASSGALVESAQVETELRNSRLDMAELKRNAERTDALLAQLARETAKKITAQVVDVTFPIRVLVKREKQVTINRGEGGGIKLGQFWNVFALGEDLVDPDTGESLGREEVLVGKVRVINVRPRTATAEILEDLGIVKGAVLRPPPPDSHSPRRGSTL